MNLATKIANQIHSRILGVPMNNFTDSTKEGIRKEALPSSLHQVALLQGRRFAEPSPSKAECVRRVSREREEGRAFFSLRAIVINYCNHV